MSLPEWYVRVDPEPFGLLERLFVARRRGGGHDVLVGCDENGPTWLFVAEGEVVPPNAGLSLPQGVARAIAEEVKPGPSAEVVNEVRATLAIERARVEKMLTWAMGAS